MSRRPSAPASDDTVVLRPGAVRRRGRGGRWKFVAAASAFIVVLTLMLVWLRGAPGIPLATEAEIVDRASGDALAMFRVTQDPDILVLDFPGLAMQGRMLDRVAAFVEKKNAPRDRALDDATLAETIRADGDTPETYYYGHDYRAADLRRFFATAAEDGVALDADEQHLERILGRLGWMRPGATGAVISLTAARAADKVDRSMRAVILHHELSHGAFFTRPDFAAGANAFWDDDLGPAERAGFERFLSGEGYDTNEHELVVNETQAYLGFTTDPRYFTPAAVGLSDAEAARLRAALGRRLPQAWPRP